MDKKLVLFVCVVFILVLPQVAAHVPLLMSDGNNSIETAGCVSDPTKSWVVYSEIEGGQAVDYYKMEFRRGERLYVSVLTPDSEGFLPDVVVMGPGLPASGEVSADVEIPDGYGYVVVESRREKREYEPFTPGSYYHLASYDVEVNETGMYYLALHSAGGQGKYGLAIGFEERYGVTEWIRVPLDVIQIHRWEGQSLLFILSPMMLCVAIGLLGVYWWVDRRHGSVALPGWPVVAVGFLYIGSGAMLLVQMALAASTSDPGFAAVVTLMFAVVPILLGGFMVRFGMGVDRELGMADRVKLVIYGLVGLVMWAGVIVGPAIAIVVGALPFSWRTP